MFDTILNKGSNILMSKLSKKGTGKEMSKETQKDIAKGATKGINATWQNPEVEMPGIDM